MAAPYWCYAQGSWLGPLSFLVLIDDLDVDCLILKYVDDTTLTEYLCVQHRLSDMELFFPSAEGLGQQQLHGG